MRYILYILAVLLLQSAPAAATSPETDSLLTVLENAQTDTARLRLHVELAQSLGTGDTTRALHHYAQALALADGATQARILRQKGNFYYRLRDYSQARHFYIKSLKKYRKEQDAAGMAKCYNNIGITYKNQNAYAQARASYDSSMQMSRQAGDSMSIANSYNNIGIVYYYQGDYPKVTQNFEQALKIYQELGSEEDMASSYNNLGSICQEQGDYPKALAYFQKYLSLSQKNDYLVGVAYAYNNMGTIYHYQKSYKKALEYYKKSLQIKKELEDIEAVAVGYRNIGGVYDEQKRYEEAIRYFGKALDINKKLGQTRELAFNMTSMGVIQYKQKNYDQALGYFREGEKYARQSGEKSAMGWVNEGFASVYLKTGKPGLAIRYGQQAFAQGKASGELELVNEACHILAQAYARTGDYQNAYQFSTRHKEASDSLFNAQRVEKITSLQKEYEFEKEKQARALQRQKEKALMEARLREERLLRNGFTGGFVLVLLLALLIFRSYHIKKKANIALTEKNALISQQKEEIQAQQDEIINQRDKLAKQNQQITDSINYASRIQQAVLPTPDFLAEKMPEHFIFFQPRDIVSGDFYYAETLGDYLIIAAADCTGHGVPGAFMSMMGVAFLNEIVRQPQIQNAANMLDTLRSRVKKSLHQEDAQAMHGDGMDIALCAIDTQKGLLHFAGAYNPLYIFRNGSLMQVKADRQPISSYFVERPFTNNELQLQPNDTLYIFSDGYADQLGGKHPKEKFKRTRLQKLLADIHTLPMAQQKTHIHKTIENWQQHNPQVDDILLMGFRIPETYFRKTKTKKTDKIKT